MDALIENQETAAELRARVEVLVRQAANLQHRQKILQEKLERLLKEIAHHFPKMEKAA